MEDQDLVSEDLGIKVFKILDLDRIERPEEIECIVLELAKESGVTVERRRRQESPGDLSLLETSVNRLQADVSDYSGNAPSHCSESQAEFPREEENIKSRMKKYIEQSTLLNDLQLSQRGANSSLVEVPLLPQAHIELSFMGQNQGAAPELAS